MSVKTPGWKDIPIGGLIIEAGNSKKYLTGGWKVQKPVLDKNKCINCMVCWVYCPDSSILIKDGKIDDFDLNHCKGCGICANECPPKIKAITMKIEE
ncbi:MAG: 4Fe-4S binding protein [Candidatus Firestonebacteria bacterium]|nr:4Fe-4S binding protein [Candidatus Firestonebacteria bacterium]